MQMITYFPCDSECGLMALLNLFRVVLDAFISRLIMVQLLIRLNSFMQINYVGVALIL